MESLLTNSAMDEAPPSVAHDDERQVRLDAYSLLAALLVAPPSAELLARLRGISGATASPNEDPEGRLRLHDLEGGRSGSGRTSGGRDPHGLLRAWSSLRLSALRAQPSLLEHEYFAVFIGLGRGLLIPFGSWYLTGSLMEKPLVRLRMDLSRLGFERQPGVHEPEDHIAALCEVMAALVGDPEIDHETQRAFFAAHLQPWSKRFFVDLQGVEVSAFYSAVGGLGEAIMTVEERYFAMPV